MRYIVQDGERYIARIMIPGYSDRRHSAVHVTDAQDAHDFKLPSKAREWQAMHAPGGQVHELNDDGSWPLEEPA